MKCVIKGLHCSDNLALIIVLYFEFETVLKVYNLGVLGHFGHGRFGHGCISPDILATENVKGGHFGHNR